MKLGKAWDSAGVGVRSPSRSHTRSFFAGISAVLLRRGWYVPAGLLATVVAALVPLIVYAFEGVTGPLVRPRASGAAAC